MKRILLLELLIAVALTINAQGTVTDCQGHIYPVVKIGNQYWMAENLQCTKYDTQSEMAGQVLASASHGQMAPFYNDPKNVTTKFCDYITAEHRKKFGLLYNYAAAMGFSASQSYSQEGTYQGRRQGICPNGFHIPSWNEWRTLCNYFGTEKEAASKLKSISGWSKSDSDYTSSSNETGFSALPVGCMYTEVDSGTGSTYSYFGVRTKFISSDIKYQNWSCTAIIDGKEMDVRNQSHYGDVSKEWGTPVRCIKN